MKSIIKNTLALLLSAVVAFSTVLSVNASLSVQYSPSSSYQSSKYYKALKNVKLTGDNAADIVNVALSQVGYHESCSSYDLSGDGTGSGSCTEYGRWYGNQTDWCNIFVSWCAYVAGVSESVFPKLPSCTQAYSSVLPSVGADCFRFDGGNSVKPGDIFFSCTCCGSDSCIDHVGIIADVDGEYIYTVEGNLTDRVQYVTYPASTGYSSNKNAQINYIARPQYKTLKLTADEIKNASAIKVTKTDILALYDCYSDSSEIKKFVSSIGGRTADIGKYTEEISSLVQKSAYNQCVVSKKNKLCFINRDGEISEYSNDKSASFCVQIPLSRFKPVNTASFGGNKYEVYDNGISYDLMRAYVKSAGGTFIAELNSAEKTLLPLLLKESSEYYFNKTDSIKNENTKSKKTGYIVKFNNEVSVVVTFDSNGGENTPIEQTAKTGEKTALTNTVPEKKNRVFLGWAWEKNAKAPDFKNGEGVIFHKNTVLYAVWGK